MPDRFLHCWMMLMGHMRNKVGSNAELVPLLMRCEVQLPQLALQHQAPTPCMDHSLLTGRNNRNYQWPHLPLSVHPQLLPQLLPGTYQKDSIDAIRPSGPAPHPDKARRKGLSVSQLRVLSAHGIPKLVLQTCMNVCNV